MNQNPRRFKGLVVSITSLLHIHRNIFAIFSHENYITWRLIDLWNYLNPQQQRFTEIDLILSQFATLDLFRFSINPIIVVVHVNKISIGQRFSDDYKCKLHRCYINLLVLYKHDLFSYWRLYQAYHHKLQYYNYN